MDVIKVGEFRENFKNYFEKAIYKDEAIVVSGPKNKSVVVISLEKYNHLKSNQMEEKTINWKDDFRYNESLHGTSQALSGVYSRLQTNFPDHKDFDNWNKEMITWSKYDRNIKDMVIPNEKLAIDETERIAKHLNKAYEIEKYLKTTTKSISIK